VGARGTSSELASECHPKQLYECDSQLVEHGASIENLRPTTTVAGFRTSKATLELLLAHGWDINACHSGSGPDAQPFMWHMVYNEDMICWCLEHGASVHPKDLEPLRDDIINQCQRSCEPILEKTAACSSVEVFELLRSRGAPLGRRTLHRAIETAVLGAERVVEPDREVTIAIQRESKDHYRKRSRSRKRKMKQMVERETRGVWLWCATLSTSSGAT
jgi:hypothetical protein